MENILKEILEELQFQTKLLTDIFEDKDEEKAHAGKTRKAVIENVAALQREILKHPAISGTPEMAGMIKNMLDLIPKGGQ